MNEVVTQVAKQAGTESGWVAAAFVVLVFVGFGAFGWLGHQLWKSYRELNEFVHKSLLGVIESNAVAFQKLTVLLRERPCLAKDDEVLDHIVNCDDSSPGG